MNARAQRAAAVLTASALAWFLCAAHAAETADGAVRESESADSARRAAAWRLTRADWSRYENLMLGRRGTWSPGADPLLVLGAHARSEAERRRLAEAFVLAEHERVEGELAFERAVKAAWKRFFPGEPRIAALAGTLASGNVDRYAMLVDRECADCGRHIRTRLEAGVPVDIYVRGAADDADLREWAGERAIEPAAVRAGLVTLNHADGAPPGPAPAVWARIYGGGWSPVRLAEVPK